MVASLKEVNIFFCAISIGYPIFVMLTAHIHQYTMISFILFSYHFCYHYYFGIFVLPGQDWKWSDQDGGEGSVGFVYRVKEDQTIYVSIVWGNTENGGKEFDKKNVTLR